MQLLAEAQISPDGLWVAYTVQTANADKEKLQKDLWMRSTDGKQHLRLTHSGDVNGKLSRDPQGQWLAFLASRGEDEEARKNAQVWRMNRSGGEAQQLTTVKTGVNDFRWSPEGQQMVLVVDRRRPARRAREDGRLEAQDQATPRAGPLPFQTGR